ncbi:OsmC family protein [Macromonas nakdongensis]|uniref:OsmC family protein n=1 Tax=Macromonas nakdongensis TaxID=1843082 RepID=UPI000C324935|nr:OsmC family protein [Macromonas nakdongensis]
MTQTATVTLTRLSGYQFQIDFGLDTPALFSDEPPPLGAGSGPAPNHLLLAAVANCLSASLVFALGKFKQDPGPIKATATATTGRNASNRLRIEAIDVHLELQKPGAEFEHLDRVLAQLEEFCTVSMSVKQGIAIGVRVSDADGTVLKG